MASVTVALRAARLPPLALTSYAPVSPETATAVTVAVVPLTAKSAAFTFETASLNVTRQVRLSALVGETVGFCRVIEATRGAVVSIATLTTMSKLSLTDSPLPSLAVTFTATVPTSAACGVPEKARVAALKVSHVGSAESSASVAV